MDMEGYNRHIAPDFYERLWVSVLKYTYINTQERGEKVCSFNAE